MTFWEHLAELRNRIIKSALAVVAGGTVVFFMWSPIQDWFREPYCEALERHDAVDTVLGEDNGEETCRFLQLDPLEGFATRMKVSGYGGIALAMPVLLWQVWRFVTPALHPKEKKYAIPFVLSGLVLFAMGAYIAYWTWPKALDFLIEIGGEGLTPNFTQAKYISLLTLMMIAFGIGFEFPILLVFLQLVNVLRPEQLARARRFSWVGIVALVAVVTPSGDPYSLFALSIPMCLFYEISILIGRVVARRRAKAAAAAASPA